MKDFGLSYEDACKYVDGIKPEDLRGRIESAEVADNPVQAKAKEVWKAYAQDGIKDVLDDSYGGDTIEFVQAFDKLAQFEPELIETYVSLTPAKAAAFVVKEGKRLKEAYGTSPKSKIDSMAKEIADLKAQLNATKQPVTTNDDEEVVKGDLPLSGVVESARVSKPRGGSFYDNI